MPADHDDIIESPGPGKKHPAPKRMLEDIWEQTAEQTRDIKTIKRAMFGDPLDQAKGLMMRVQALELAETRRRKLVWAALIAGVAALVDLGRSLVMHLFTGGRGQ